MYFPAPPWSLAELKVGVIHYSLNTMGGGEFVCLCTIEAFHNAGHEVVLYTAVPTNWARSDEIFAKRIRPDKEELFLKSLDFVKGLTPYKKLLSNFSLRRIGKEVDLTIDTQGGTLMVDADLVYMHYPETLQPPSNRPKGVARNWYLEPYYELVKLMEKSKGKLIIANSDFTALQLKKFLGRDAVIVYPPIEVEKYRRALEAKRVTDSVLSISRFSHEKNLEKIPEIAKQVRSNVTFYVAGTLRGYDDTYAQVQKKVETLKMQDSVFLLSNISDAEKLKLLSKAKVFLHLIKTEPFGIAPVEAMAAGLIPIVHHEGGQRFTCPEEWQYNSFDEIPELINKALDSWNPKLASELSKSTDRFDATRFERRIVEVAESYLRERKNGLGRQK